MSEDHPDYDPTKMVDDGIKALLIRGGRIRRTTLPPSEEEVGGEILDVELDDDGGRERAAAIARDFEAFADATVAVSDDGITVTSPVARQYGTDLLVALRDAGLTVTGFNVRAPTLDDVFLAITGEELDRESGVAE